MSENVITDVETEVDGVVKWFDRVRGFGFVIAEEGGPDILLHVNVLRSFGRSSVVDGARICLKTQSTGRGVQATEVIAIYAPDPELGIAADTVADETDEDLSDVPLEPARVKWFDKAKGFGFANVFGDPADVFVHIEVLRKCGMSDLQPGEALAIKVVSGKRGSMAAEVQTWENAVDDA